MIMSEVILNCNKLQGLIRKAGDDVKSLVTDVSEPRTTDFHTFNKLKSNVRGNFQTCVIL